MSIVSQARRPYTKSDLRTPRQNTLASIWQAAARSTMILEWLANELQNEPQQPLNISAVRWPLLLPQNLPFIQSITLRRVLKYSGLVVFRLKLGKAVTRQLSRLARRNPIVVSVGHLVVQRLFNLEIEALPESHRPTNWQMSGFPHVDPRRGER